MKPELAIVIPAYKDKFLEQALESIARQSDKRFIVYVGDDCSKDNIFIIIEKFKDQIPIVYKRFKGNLGLHSLVLQWQRCVALTQHEEFIWLFSDDDIMPDNAVESFYQVIKDNDRFDLYRFNTRLIDENGKFKDIDSNHPKFETAENFILRRLRGETISFACEYIFSRQVFYDAGGFEKFPLAWCSDDSTWYKIGKRRGYTQSLGNQFTGDHLRSILRQLLGLIT